MSSMQCKTWALHKHTSANFWSVICSLGCLLFLSLCKFALFSSIIKGAMTPFNFSLTVIASLPCTNYLLPRLQAFSKVFSIKIEKKKNCPRGQETKKSQSGLCSSLNDSRKTEAGNYSITVLAVARRNYPMNILAAEHAQGCWGNARCWTESITRYSELIIKCLTVFSQV